MDVYSRHLADRLREREQELEKLHRSFREVRNKFTQLECAFQINLQTQQEREDELNLLRLESQGKCRMIVSKQTSSVKLNPNSIDLN